MAMRNAFGEIATEETLRFVLKAVSYARDISGRMRVIVDGTTATVGSIYWGNANGNPTYYSTGAPNAMDAREVHRQQSLINGEIARQKWTYS